MMIDDLRHPKPNEEERPLNADLVTLFLDYFADEIFFDEFFNWSGRLGRRSFKESNVFKLVLKRKFLFIL
jgi:hypothetical protein